ncbi:MAG: adenylate/guanylate cyclase domain-containing protein [Bacteroidetes bacterium]|nr:adenylate/guanylate cyclase domain-containing protein [Bacteroidota bacterium]
MHIFAKDIFGRFYSFLKTAGLRVRILSMANVNKRTAFLRVSLYGLLLFSASLNAGDGFCASHPATKIPSQKNPDPLGQEVAAIDRLARLADIYCNYFYDVKTADSLAEEAIRIAEKSSRQDLYLKACFNYLEIIDLSSAYFDKAEMYGLKALSRVKNLDDPILLWRINKDLAELYLSVAPEKNSPALKFSNKTLAIAGRIGKNTLRVKSYLLFARSLEGKNQKTKAHVYFLNALELAEKIKDPLLMIDCYSQLAGFYSRNRMFEQSVKFNLKEEELTKNVFRGDSVRQMWVLWYLTNNGRVSGTSFDEQLLHHLLTFSMQHHAKKLKLYTLALFRSYYIDSDRIDKLYDLYKKQYPQELSDLESNDSAIYYRLMAYFKEREKDPDSAIYFLKKAEPLMLKNPSKYMLSQFYYRYGQFLNRQNEKKEALEKFHLAYKIAGEVPFFDFMLNASRQLEALYFSLGDYRNAFTYSVTTRSLGDSINDMVRKEQMILDGMNREQLVRERIVEGQKRESERMIKQKKTERNMLAGFVAFLFLVSFVIFRNYRQQKRLNIRLDQEKKRSDNLLLNILPGETAEELKQTGTAKAKKFESVTVMFTDFKNFTQASEQLKPDELVEEIHFYFTEFDRIVTRYGIEKIKTIGDSYMCVAGLPVVSATHAKDVVSAAFDFQEFMEDQKKVRAAAGKHWFELRIGIHTGPVVAGIVGTRKFAYDIWGDTVNTAARMESCGEIGKVNISGATYDCIRDYFNCTYRGKVQAKHKGLVDMYFAEGRL